MNLQARNGLAAGWDEVAVRYPYAGRDAVGPVSLELMDRERLLLLGPSGSGKSTLLQTLTGLIPHALPATVSGEISLFGEKAAARKPADWADDVAFLFQDAEQALCGFTVEDELAFAPENRGLPPERISQRVASAMMRVGIPDDWRARRIATLSGGEKQLVAIAAMLTQQARLAVLDEPSASLTDPAAARVARLFLGPERQGGAIIVDHRLAPVLSAIDRVAVLSHSGRLIADGPPHRVFGNNAAALSAEGIWLPLACRLRLTLEAEGHRLPDVLATDELMEALDRLPDESRKAARQVIRREVLPDRNTRSGAPLVRLDEAAFGMPFGPVTVAGVSLTLHEGEVLGIVGRNGAGKSTLALGLTGLVRPRAGRRSGPVGAMAFQNAEAHFSRETAAAELAHAGAGDPEAALVRWGLAHVAGEHPFRLSQGQKRRLALASLSVGRSRRLIVLDEPTAGLDHRGAATIGASIDRFAAEGRGIAVISHDLDFILAHCDRVAVIDGGRLVAHGPAPAILCDADLMTQAGLAPPEAARLLRKEAACTC